MKKSQGLKIDFQALTFYRYYAQLFKRVLYLIIGNHFFFEEVGTGLR